MQAISNQQSEQSKPLYLISDLTVHQNIKLPGSSPKKNYMDTKIVSLYVSPVRRQIRNHISESPAHQKARRCLLIKTHMDQCLLRGIISKAWLGSRIRACGQHIANKIFLVHCIRVGQIMEQNKDFTSYRHGAGSQLKKLYYHERHCNIFTGMW